MTEVERLRRRVAELEEQAELNLALAEELGRSLRRAQAEIETYRKRIGDPEEAERQALQRTAARARLHRRDLHPDAKRRAIKTAVELGVIDEFRADEMLEDWDA